MIQRPDPLLTVNPSLRLAKGRGAKNIDIFSDQGVSSQYIKVVMYNFHMTLTGYKSSLSFRNLGILDLL